MVLGSLCRCMDAVRTRSLVCVFQVEKSGARMVCDRLKQYNPCISLRRHSDRVHLAFHAGVLQDRLLEPTF